MADEVKQNEEVKEEGAEQDPSMEEILQTIRGVISGDEEEKEDSAKEQNAKSEEESVKNEDDNDDVLELTEMVEEKENTGTKEQEKQEAAPENPETNEDGSVLDDIDNALSQQDEADAKASQQAEEENKEDGPQIEPAPQEEPETAPTQQEAKTATDEKLLSDDSVSSSKASLTELTKHIPKPQIDQTATRGGTTVEDLVIEAIKPFLKDWLDQNLPAIVNELVQKEIKKIAPSDDN